jgi:hypothetical protein
MASYFCDESLGEELNHAPITNTFDIFRLFDDTNNIVIFITNWRGSAGHQYITRILMEDGKCMTFNQINQNLLFRNDTVDPNFLQQFQFSIDSETDPKSWNIETGYTPNRMQYYPLKSLRKGMDAGLRVKLEVFSDYQKTTDTRCRKDYENIEIALHHPAEVALKSSFISVPFNKSVSMMVKPKITTTSDSLKSYDPEV